ncbi:MAG: outer membrane lipid asymmetry maintenance protein MlaD [bacterium]|nr:outer membrane lipid asymmetry maintenance protein MlaD [bacterium]
MQSHPARDLVVGLFVLAGISALAYLSTQLGGLSFDGQGGFTLRATFDEIGGLSARSPVVISGVPVGQVVAINLDEDLRAAVELDLEPGLELPVDTSASIRTSGLLGDQFIALEPGGEDELLEAGDILSFTESALNFEKLIGSFVHDAGLGGSE